MLLKDSEMPWMKSNNIPNGITHFNGYMGGRHGLASDISEIDMDRRASSRPATKKKIIPGKNNVK
jgi:hypothetical protein